MVASSLFLSPIPFSLSKPNLFSNAHLQSNSILPLPSLLPSTRPISSHKHSIPLWRISSFSNNNFLISEASSVEPTTEQLLVAPNDSSSMVVSVLVFVAFLGLSVLTIGVIYIGVTDFLQKRENEKLQKEGETDVKDGGTKFGQKGPSNRGFGVKKFEGQKKKRTDRKPKPKPMPKPKPTAKTDNKPKSKQKPKGKSRGK